MRIPSLSRIVRVLSLTGVVALATSVGFAQGTVGEWNVSMSFGENEIAAVLTISSAPDGSLTGTWSSERGGGEISDIAFEDGKLSFVRRLDFGGQSFEMTFRGTIEGDQLNGAFVTDFGEMALAGTRAPAATSPLAGTWEVTSNSQLGELKRKLIIDANHTGTYQSEDAKWPVQNLKLEGDTVTFSVTVDLQGQELPLDFSGTLDGTRLVGTYSIPQMGAAADVVAVKVPATVRVLLVTTAGEIEIEVQIEKAPITSANFLRYVDEGFYNGGRFHRAVRLDNQRRNDILIEVIQGGVNPDRRQQGYDPIPLERTNATGLKHLDGTVSMARGGPDTARSDIFICINAQPSLDFGGQRNADGQGFAAFATVVRGMEVVREIQGSATTEGESLTPPIEITTARRMR